MIDKELTNQLEQLAKKIRVDIIRTGYLAGKNGAHFGGSLSPVEILAVLYTCFVSFDKNDMEHRDRVILSKGHAALAQYCTLYECGIMTKTDLDSFEQNGSDIVAHAKRNLSRGLDFSGGSLSLGTSYSVGVAHACKRKGLDNHIYTLIGDGEMNEGLIWEALMFAGHNRLDNLTIIVDHNHLQADGTIEEVMNTAPLEDKLKAFGFDVIQVDGHSVSELYEAFSQRPNGRPMAIIAETVKGKGVSFIENKAKWHHSSLNEARYQKALKDLGEEFENG